MKIRILEYMVLLDFAFIQRSSVIKINQIGSI